MNHTLELACLRNSDFRISRQECTLVRTRNTMSRGKIFREQKICSVPFFHWQESLISQERIGYLFPERNPWKICLRTYSPIKRKGLSSFGLLVFSLLERSGYTEAKRPEVWKADITPILIGNGIFLNNLSPVNGYSMESVRPPGFPCQRKDLPDKIVLDFLSKIAQVFWYMASLSQYRWQLF